jgi:hypothetical protein
MPNSGRFLPHTYALAGASQAASAIAAHYRRTYPGTRTGRLGVGTQMIYPWCTGYGYSRPGPAVVELPGVMQVSGQFVVIFLPLGLLHRGHVRPWSTAAILQRSTRIGR